MKLVFAALLFVLIAAPPAPIIQLSEAILTIKLNADSPVGEYKVKAKVHDINADNSFELETEFNFEK